MNFTQLFFVEACEGWAFQGSGAVFYGENRGGGETRMGGFAAEFRGFRAESGCGEAVQRTADSAGAVGAKKVFKNL